MAASCGGTEPIWSELIKAAQQEGEVAVAGPPNPEVNKAVPAAFKKQFNINVSYLAGSSGQTAEKIRNERAAGIYSLDIFLAGANTMANVIYKSGWLDKLKDDLVSPTLTDQSTWVGKSSNAPFVDEPAFDTIAEISMQGQEQFLLNTDLVAEGEIQAWKDLLHPKWKGKIVAMDPTRGSGLGFKVVEMLANTLGFDFVSQLYKDQKVVLQTDDRQAADAVAKGQYAVAIGVSQANGQIDKLLADGLPVRVITSPSDTPQMVSAGYGWLALMGHAPHPAAAKLFANWVLCPDGNKVWNEANRYQSTRADVDIDVPEFIRADADGDFWDTYDWKMITSSTAGDFLDQIRGAVR